ncbi:Ferric cupric reductase transmembrane component 7 [Fusarium albosuccineum]|uniref:ferric-chelate reductase (NADPH) n=1 Tax=Fusarium albosuccineum TaxID=1237068 RepID=A0A8H4PG02_9HYPO|nr:Ferric cupric reductase transmembrane component 7 [Fusarium albosuccineum]
MIKLTSSNAKRYIADHVYALPTVAFFMSAIGVFIIGHFISYYVLGIAMPRYRGPRPWRVLIAAIRYLSYRGFHVKSCRWNSAPVGILLLGAIGTVFFFCIATATKTNWITLLTGISHERLQVFHRWIAYAFFVLALLHTFPFIVYHIRFHDMEMHFEMSLLFYWTGIVALIFQAWLTFASHSVIRNLGYEFFKMTHFFAAVIFILTFFWHCDYILTSWHYFIATAAVYVPCFVYPWLRTCFEYGTRQAAHVKVEDNGFIRVTIPAKFTWKPGQHCFLRFTGFGFTQALSAHPFTICSLPSTSTTEQSFLVFYLGHKSGFTAKLYDYALENPGASVSVLVDGPYGAINTQPYVNSSHLLVIAGGSGAGWTLPFIEQFVASHSIAGDEERGEALRFDNKETNTCKAFPESSTSPFFSLRVILATRDTDSRIWYRKAVNQILLQYSTKASSGVHVQLYLTGEAAAQTTTASNNSSSMSQNDSSANEGGSESALSVDELNGRPDLPTTIQQVAKEMTTADSLGVYVCGPDTMQNDVRNAVAAANLDILRGSKSGGAYLHCEHFSWA